MKFSPTSSLILDNLRVPLAIGVLMSHAFAGLLDNKSIPEPSTIGEHVFRCLLRVSTESMPPLVVPGFFLLSGFFFFLKWTEENDQKVWDWSVYKDKLYKRIYTLLIPYILWNILPVAIGLIGATYEGLMNGSNLAESARLFLQGKGLRIFWSFYNVGVSKVSVFGIPLSINTAPFNYPLYYLRDLMGICILSPLIFWCIKHIKIFFIIFIVLLGFFGILPSYPGLRSSALLFFSIGAYFSINNLDIVEKLRGRVLPSFATSLLLLCLVINDSCPSALQLIYVLVGLLTLIRIVDRCVSMYSISASRKIIGSIFFFYAAHEGLYVLQGIQSAICFIIPSVSYACVFAQYFLIICLTFLVCVLIRGFVYRWMPSIGKLLGA